MIEHASGSLLQADVEALVNSVNTAGVMGKGIALQFKQAFPANFDAYRRARGIRGARHRRLRDAVTMELLATLHRVAEDEPEARTNADTAVRGVHAWSERKRQQFSAKHVTVAWEHLRRHGWL